MLERPGSKARRAAHEFARDARQDGLSLLTIPVAMSAARFLSFVGWRKTKKYRRNCAQRREDSLSRSPRTINCLTQKIHFRTPNLSLMNCSKLMPKFCKEESIDLPRAAL